MLLAVLVLFALVLVTVDFRTDGGDGHGPLGWLRGAVSSVLGPIQEGLATIVSPIGQAVGDFSDLFELRAENERLRARLAALEERRVSYEDQVRQNRDLRALLDLEDDADIDTVAARVIDLGSSNFEWTITINVGTDDGIVRDMVVVNGDGLVGRVIQTTRSTARVLLAIDLTFGAPARIAGSGEVGPVRGDGGDPLIFSPFDPEAEVQVGDELVTSLYSNSSFPDGIPIGTVVDAGDSSDVLGREILIRPFVDFTRLDVVLVMLTEPEDANFEERLPVDEPFSPPVIVIPSEEPSDAATQEPLE